MSTGPLSLRTLPQAKGVFLFFMYASWDAGGIMRRHTFICAALLLFVSGIALAANFTIQETESITLFVNTSDPDGDPLEVIYPEYFDESGTWQTSYGDQGAYVATITVTDGKLTSSENVQIVVRRKEEAPSIQLSVPQRAAIGTHEGRPSIFGIRASDLNLDNLSIIWKVDDEAVAEDIWQFMYFPGYEESGFHTVSVEVADGFSTAIQEWFINVADNDRKPAITPVNNVHISEGESISIAIIAADPDNDMVSITADNLPTGAEFSGNTLTWSPGYDTVRRSGFVNTVLDKYHALAVPFTVTFKAMSRNATAMRYVTLWVADVNREPVISGAGSLTVTEGEAISLEPAIFDPDGDELDIRYSGWLSRPSYATHDGDAGEHVVKVTASDGWLSAEKSIAITVLEGNFPPVIDPIPRVHAVENQTAAIAFSAKDPDGDRLRFEVSGLAGASINGSMLLYTPSFAVSSLVRDAVLNATLIAHDGRNTVMQGFSVQVKNANRLPQLLQITVEPKAEPKAGEIVTFTADAVDADGDTLAYTWDFGPFESYGGGDTIARLYTKAGAKRIRLKVSDGDRAISTGWDIVVRE